MLGVADYPIPVSDYSDYFGLFRRLLIIIKVQIQYTENLPVSCVGNFDILTLPGNCVPGVHYFSFPVLFSVSNFVILVINLLILSD